MAAKVARLPVSRTRKITIVTTLGALEVKAKVYGLWAVHPVVTHDGPDPRHFTITHVGTGMVMVARVEPTKVTAAIAELAGSALDWSLADGKASITPAHMEAWRAFRAKYGVE